MTRKAIVPKELQAYYDDWKMAPGHLSGNHLFLTGFTGANADGSLSPDPETQMRSAFDKIGYVMRDAGLGFGALVEMTTYHVGLREHLDTFIKVKDEFVAEPYPAWTAIGVSELITEGALLEIRIIATYKRD